MQVALVIPCYRVRGTILSVLERIGPEPARIFVVDDCCPEQTGDLVREKCQDPRVKVLHHADNRGVGGATVTGYRAALAEGFDIIVKLDGDGQMDPRLIPRLVAPIVQGKADYCKGNRFYDLHSLRSMPSVRLFGNSVLSFLSKAATGYWNLMDPTNGFTAVHRHVLDMVPLSKIDERYFFETDMLFRLNIIRAAVWEVPMAAVYEQGQTSSLSILNSALSFPGKFASRFCKRIFYNYVLRDFNVGSLELFLGAPLFFFGLIFGIIKWYNNYLQGVTTPTGTVMVAALPVILGFQLLAAALTYDVMNVPRQPIHEGLSWSAGAPRGF